MSSTFDVDAWLDEAQPPTRAVRIYGRGDLVARLQQLNGVEHDDVPGFVDDRLAGPAPSAPSFERDALVAELEESARTFVVRGLLDSEQAQVLDQAKTADAVDEQLYETTLVALFVVEPPLTVGQAARLKTRIGQAQWDALFAGATEASKETIDVPLSRLGSGTGQAS